ncbi:hypothetical protein B0H14DRAFT_2600109 [Mycena olivaceomarginata]|nr:hypothetical protein B0H14DRAFT_2600109 [Mycena olivaceomarginata]
MPSELTRMEAYVLGAWFAHYTSCNKRDSIWMKLFVAGLALMTTLKSLQSIVMTWIQNVATSGNGHAASNLLHTYWLAKITLILGAITAFYVQMFFCRRLWYDTSRSPVLALTPATTDLLHIHSFDRVGDRLEYVFTIGVDY